MNRPSLCLAALACLLAAAPTVMAGPPNVVFIMADDVGLGDIGYYHRQRTGKAPVAPTPNLDSLAAAGMRFSDAHSSTALCSPTRYCAMSGNLNYRSNAPWGVWGSFRPTPFTDTDATLGRIAQSAGLTTAFIGKWHLGGDFGRADGKGIYRGADRGDKPLGVDVSKMIAGGPPSTGFDYSYTLPCGIQGPLYVAYENGAWSPFAADSRIIHFSAKSAGDPAYVSDKGPGMGDSRWDPSRVGPMIAAKAAAFIENSAAEEKPFFLCYWTPAVHLPHLPPAQFDGRKVRGETPTRHLDMLIDLDQQVGKIVGALRGSDVLDNTLLIFSSDNGGLNDARGQAAGHDSSGGYRGFKNQPYEGGHRVPFFAVWPGKIEPGSRSDEPVAVHDVAATMAAAVGAPLGPQQAQDSYNLLPLLLGQAGFVGRDELLLQGGSQHEVIYRRGDWKLIVQSNRPATQWRPAALFNLAQSPLEAEGENLIDDPEQAARVKSMLQRYRQLRSSGERTAPPTHPETTTGKAG
ncbi:Arylsulfatase precursor [Pirellulimonas nuda]|uniref:Arylsulfatase n=1 Tax=Pirellulimonas nuda TaxID=2528009 RepID=A0A518DFM1_9BACT|nr:arylsulfatase [Pirellulimonas nuda]QDU90275.1 Arylsulfatase precursor [Pirellulimonas nuda]